MSVILWKGGTLPQRDNFKCIGDRVVYVMSETKQLSAELHETYGSENRQFRNELTAHINVLEDGEWIGDFFATFTRQRLGGSDKYVADWDSIKQGNGIYTDREPCFWPVEEVVDELNEKYELQEFVALDTGPNDI